MKYNDNEITLEELLYRTNQWFYDRNLNNADSNGQLVKLYEEVNELHKAHYNNDEEEKIDAVGDILVVLTGYCLQQDLDLNMCWSKAYDIIKDRKGKLVNGIFVKES